MQKLNFTTKTYCMHALSIEFWKSMKTKLFQCKTYVAKDSGKKSAATPTNNLQLCQSYFKYAIYSEENVWDWLLNWN